MLILYEIFFNRVFYQENSYKYELLINDLEKENNMHNIINSNLKNEVDELKNKLEILSIKHNNLEKYQADLILFKKNFPNLNLNSLVSNLTNLEEVGMDLTRKVSVLEDERRIFEKEKTKMKDNFFEKIAVFSRLENEKKKGN